MMEVEKAATGIISIITDATEGINFYQRLADYLKSIKQQVSDYSMARTEEKNAMLQAMGVNP